MKQIRNIQTARWVPILTGATILLALLILPFPAFCGGVVTNATEAALNTALVGGGTVIFACDGTITLTGTKVITNNLVLDATGHSIVISGGNAVQLFNGTAGGTNAITLYNLTLANGKSTIYQSGFGVAGGAIYCGCRINASNCTFSNNVAQGTNGAAGANSGNGAVGKAGSDAYGGAISDRGGQVFLTNCVFINNLAIGGQGGAGGNATSGSGNGGKGGAGGKANGGAIQSNNGVLPMNCNFSGNIAVGGIGGQGGDYGSSHTGAAGLGGDGGDGAGGAEYTYVWSSYSCYNGNAAYGGNAGLAGLGTTTGKTGATGGNAYGGALYMYIYCWPQNVTFYGNNAVGGNGGSLQTGTGAGGNGGNGNGGGIYFTSSGGLGDFAGITNCTFSSNGAYGGAAGVGFTSGIVGQSLGGNLRVDAPVYADTCYLKNSILAYSTSGGNVSSSGTMVDSGENISSDGSVTLSGPGSLMNTDPLLASLDENGGFTETCALQPGSPAINTGDDTAAPFTDQRGYLRPDRSDIGAYEYNGWTPLIYAAGPTASLDGNVGLFFIDRLTTNTTSPLTVNFTIGGTASNGVDYVAISNSVTIPAGARYVNIPIQGITNAFSGTSKTVVLTLVSGTNYQIVPNNIYPGVATVTIFDHNTYDNTRRFVRGSSTAPDFQSLVVPLDYETGVPLAAVGGNATNLFPGNPWTTNFYHYNATNVAAIQTSTAGRIVFQNPIVAFGDTVGGSPLYLNRNYNFAVASATPSTEPTAVRIQVYYRSNSAYAGTVSLTIPNTADTNQLTQWVTNGFTVTASGFGLQTTMFASDSMDFGLLFGADYRLTHNASSIATNYYFVVEEQSGGIFNNVVLNQSGAPDWSKLYAMEFSPRPAYLSTFIDQPQFNGKPLPPAYQGMSLQELTNVVPTLPNLSSLNPSNYLTIDGSPELRRHPILDQFVKNMGNDPLALANYVVNEIDLTDAIDYDTNYNSQPAVNIGGVNRSALGTFQEGQGSPLEQCELLVYLLRQAGVPATYVFPTNGGLQMLDFQLSKLLRMQVHGAMNTYGQTNLPALINVNYPWVAAHIGTNWVQIFPWLKDTEITEGLNFYDYMPTNYNSGYKWLRAFIAHDTNIFSLSSSDQPLDLLPAFIQHNLDLNHYGLSVNDMGVQIVNRRHLYSQWNQFPEPFALSGAPLVIESLKTNLTLFNTIEVQVYSEANPGRMLDTTEMRIADLHNRMLLLKFLQVGTNFHDMILTLEAYSPAVTNQTIFSTNADSTWKLSATNLLDSTDDRIAVHLIHKRNRFLPANYNGPDQLAVSNLWGYNYFETAQHFQTYTWTDAVFRKGDWAALCLNLGKVSQRMLNVHAQEIWQFNRTADTNQPSTLDPDIYIGQAVYLLGMSYWSYYDRFNEFNDRLHKIQVASSFGHGFGIMRPKHDSSGELPDGGTISPVAPSVHMLGNGIASVFNGSLRPDSGYTYGTLSRLDWWLQGGVAGAAAEHGALRSYYQTNALSSITLLQQAGTNIVDLNLGNYLSAGEVTHNGVKLKNADTNLWNQITSFFANGDPEEEALVTPGVLTNGTYVGTGAILFNSGDFNAPVGGFNGGFADFLPDPTFSFENSPNITVDPAPENSITPFQLLTTSTADSSGDSDNLVSGATATWQQSSTANSLASGQTQLDPSLAQSFADLATLYGTPQNASGTYSQLYNNGTASTQIPAYNDGSQRISDPVNLMTGEFYIDAPDITLPGPMPLQIRRNYGSQNLAENEFGFGWKISYVPFLSVGTNSTLIYAAEMDGTMVAYRQTGTNANVWLPQPQDNPTLNNNSSIGIGSVGNLFNNRLQLSTPGGTNTYTLAGVDGSIRTFTQASYPVGTFTRQRPYLNLWQDSKGNYYRFQYGTDSTQPDYGEVNRIQSSNGNFVWFEYDVYGHVIAAHTGDGRILNYVYDQYGDLVSVTLPDQMEIDYSYQHSNYVTNGVTNVYSTHLIVEEDKPDGRVLQNIYDSQRRVTNQLSTAGVDLNPVRTAAFTYTNNFSLSSPTNLLTGITVISDYFNHPTTYYYTNSLVRKIVDPLNQTIVQNWFETNTVGGFQRSLQSVTDKRGLKTAYLYDARGNLTNAVTTGDLTGNGIPTQTSTNTASYNANNLPAQVTDPVGNGTVVVYDPTFTFLPQQVIRYAGATPVSTNFQIYANVTNVVVNGSLTQTNLAFGVLTRQIRAYSSSDAATNDSAYNGQGFVTGSIQYSGTGDPNVTNQFFYNERGELVQRTDAVGADCLYDFDPMGRPTSQETFDSGQVFATDWKFQYYNANGEINWIDGARYNPEDYIFYDYDGAGRPTTEIHWRSEANSSGTGVQAPAGYNLYAQTFNQYDPLGNLVSKVDPRGAVTTNSWDALSRLVKTTHLNTNGVTVLSTDGFGYEPGGQVQSHTNALGAITTTLYTSTGKPKYRSNADGSTNGWLYYLDGRTYREIQGNGAYWQTIYNDANRITTRVFYSAAGVPEATNSVQLDRRGNAIQKVDEGGNVFTTAFDGLDRAKISAGPAIITVIQNSGMSPGGPYTYTTNVLQQAVTNFYDAAGRAFTNVNALGEMTVAFADAIGRPTQKKIFSATGTLVRQTSITYSTDHNSVTTTNGSGASAVVNTTYTDTDGHNVLAIAYPAANTTEFTLNQFDPAGNQISSQHDSSVSGTVTTWTTTSVAYDGLNRPIAKSDRDNALTTYAYDPMSDLTNRTMPFGLQWLATYNSAGQMLLEKNIGDGSATRTNTYSYYSSGNIFAGLLQTKTDGRGVSCTYIYDDWLRPTNMAYSGSLPEQNLTTVWQYEPRGFVIGITEQFATTNTGPTTSIQRSFDPYGQLASESVSAGAFGYGTSQYFDAAGRRSQLGLGGGYGFGWQADGSLISVSAPNGSGAYAYDTAGLLTSRTVGSRYTSINSRDGEGRPLSIATTVNTMNVLTESLSWLGDGLLASHTLVRSDFTDSRAYAYASLSRRLVQEQQNLNASATWTNTLAYDNGVASGPGVLTKMGLASGASNLWSGAADAFSRVSNETNSTFQYAAYGHVNGQSSLEAWLDNQSIPITGVGTNAMQWRAMMELTPGTHQLKVAAAHPSGFYTAWATNSFTNTLAYQSTADSYDAAGNITNRVWKNPSGTVERTQTLSWDARGRLHAVTERDGGNSGYNWSATYDGLNRRLATTSIFVTNGVAFTSQPTTINSYYDPQVEFLELGVSYGITTEWKLYGPDLNGVYGGLNGTGGFDAVSPYLNLFDPTISDARGNILGYYDPKQGSVVWNSARPTGYGSVPNYRPVALANGTDLSLASAWRGRWVDITGYYNIGLRPYDPISGRWLTYDSDWNERDPNYYSFAGDDPVNGFDSKGKCVENTAPSIEFGIAPVMETSIQTILHFENGTSASTGLPGQPELLYDPSQVAGSSYNVVTQPTGQYQYYQSQYGLPADYGQTTITPITTTQIEQQQRAQFIIGTATVLGAVLTDTEPLLEGSGPASGFLEVSSSYGSSKAVQNFASSTATDFIYDTQSQRFVMGSGSLGHDSVLQAAGIAPTETTVGGTIWRENGSLMTDEWSGHYGMNWTPDIRQQFQGFMQQNGVNITHIPWK